MTDHHIIPPSNPKHEERKGYAILIGAIIALIAGIALLIEFAVGIILLIV